MRWGSVALLVVAACGTFSPVDEPGPGTLEGCLTTASGAAAAAIPVFVVSESRPVAETRSDASGCFSVTAPSGRQLLVAHDFRGQGVVESVRLYAGQRLSVRRTLATLALNPVLPTLRGVGSGEALGALHSTAVRLHCDDREQVLRLTTEQGPVVVDARTGEPHALPAPATVTEVPWASPRYALSWQGAPFQPAGDGWSTVALNEHAFFARAVSFDQLGAGGRPAGAWYGTAERTFALDDECELFDDGACLSVRLDGGAVALTRHVADGGTHHQQLELGGEVLLAVPTVDGARLAAVTNDDAGVSVWQLDEGAVRLAHFAGARADHPSGSSGPRTGAAEDRPTVRLTDDAGVWWVAIDARAGAVERVPFPQPGPDAFLLFEWYGRASPSRVLEALRRDSPDTWQLTLFEHLGATVRARTLTVPLATVPDYARASSGFADSVYFPGFDFLPAGQAGLEVFRLGKSVRVLRAGAPLEAARPIATLGLDTNLACLAGPSLLTSSAGSDFARQAVRYDIARIANELASDP